jgi:acetyltransferase-like isoleucine patch superfamily enzyme
MPILRTLMERALTRYFRDDLYQNRFMRRYFERQYGIKIGLYSDGCFDRWRIPPGTVIGRYCSFTTSCRVIDANHLISALSTHPFFYIPALGFAEAVRTDIVAPVIEDDVWVGHGAVILPECKVVGRGSIIGAGAVVGRDVPRYGVMIGSPARLVRYRFEPDVIEAIEATEWWLMDWDELCRTLSKAREFFTEPSVASAQAFMRARGHPERTLTAIASPSPT